MDAREGGYRFGARLRSLGLRLECLEGFLKIVAFQKLLDQLGGIIHLNSKGNYKWIIRAW